MNRTRMTYLVFAGLLFTVASAHPFDDPGKYPPSDPQTWDQAKKARREARAKTIREVESAVLASFRQQVPKALSGENHLVDYEESQVEPRSAFAVIVHDIDGAAYGDAYLVCFRINRGGNYEKMSEISLQGSYSGQYEIELVATDREMTPLLHLFRNQGAAFRWIKHELYRVKSFKMKRVWQWVGSYATGHTGLMPYYFTNVDFSGLSSGSNEFTLYETYTEARQEKNVFLRRKKTFRWNASSGQYLKTGK